MLGPGGRPRRMVSLGKVSTPKPVNLPSQRKENNGNDPSVDLIRKAGSGTWGSVSAAVPSPSVSEGNEVMTAAAGDTAASAGAPTRAIPAGPSPAWGGLGLPEERKRALEEASRERQFPALGAAPPQSHGASLEPWARDDRGRDDAGAPPHGGGGGAQGPYAWRGGEARDRFAGPADGRWDDVEYDEPGRYRGLHYDGGRGRYGDQPPASRRAIESQDFRQAGALVMDRYVPPPPPPRSPRDAPVRHTPPLPPRQTEPAFALTLDDGSAASEDSRMATAASSVDSRMAAAASSVADSEVSAPTAATRGEPTYGPPPPAPASPPAAEPKGLGVPRPAPAAATPSRPRILKRPESPPLEPESAAVRVPAPAAVQRPFPSATAPQLPSQASLFDHISSPSAAPGLTRDRGAPQPAAMLEVGPVPPLALRVPMGGAPGMGARFAVMQEAPRHDVLGAAQGSLLHAPLHPAAVVGAGGAVLGAQHPFQAPVALQQVQPIWQPPVRPAVAMPTHATLPLMTFGNVPTVGAPAPAPPAVTVPEPTPQPATAPAPATQQSPAAEAQSAYMRAKALEKARQLRGDSAAPARGRGPTEDAAPREGAAAKQGRARGSKRISKKTGSGKATAASDPSSVTATAQKHSGGGRVLELRRPADGVASKAKKADADGAESAGATGAKSAAAPGGGRKRGARGGAKQKAALVPGKTVPAAATGKKPADDAGESGAGDASPRKAPVGKTRGRRGGKKVQRKASESDGAPRPNEDDAPGPPRSNGEPQQARPAAGASARAGRGRHRRSKEAAGPKMETPCAAPSTETAAVAAP